MYFKEWCLKPSHRKGVMLPLETIRKFESAPDAGYASVYMFDADAAAEIKASQSSSGLARYPVFADTLTLDLDKGAEQLALVEQKLAGYGYKVYDSGGKGFHVVIPLLEPVSGTNVPYSQRRWAEWLDVGADLSLYQAGHIISLPGRRHPKTGRRKTLVREVAGQAIDLPLVAAPAGPSFAIADSDQSELERGLWRTLALLQQEPEVGGRHVALWSTAKHFADAGLDFDSTLNLLTEVNAKWAEPKTAEELKAAVSQAYRRTT